MARRLGGILLVAVLGLAGCATEPVPTIASPSLLPSPSSSPSGGDSPEASPSMPPILELGPLACGSPLAFRVDALRGQPGAETSTHLAAQALRDLLAGDGVIPDRDGWRIVALSASDALFLLPAEADEGSDYWNAEFHRGQEGWEYVRSGQCDLMLALGELELASWELGSEVPDDGAMSVVVLVTELGCASGERATDRIVQAGEAYFEDSIVVVLGTRPLPGPQTCEPAPPTEFTVQLEEPVNGRTLFDGSNLPRAQDP